MILALLRTRILERVNSNSRISKLLNYLSGLISRTIVDDEFKIIKCLCQNRIDSFCNGLFSVVGGNHHRNGRVIHSQGVVNRSESRFMLLAAPLLQSMPRAVLPGF